MFLFPKRTGVISLATSSTQTHTTPTDTNISEVEYDSKPKQKDPVPKRTGAIHKIVALRGRRAKYIYKKKQPYDRGFPTYLPQWQNPGT